MKNNIIVTGFNSRIGKHETGLYMTTIECASIWRRHHLTLHNVLCSVQGLTKYSNIFFYLKTTDLDEIFIILYIYIYTLLSNWGIWLLCFYFNLPLYTPVQCVVVKHNAQVRQPPKVYKKKRKSRINVSRCPRWMTDPFGMKSRSVIRFSRGFVLFPKTGRYFTHVQEYVSGVACLNDVWALGLGLMAFWWKSIAWHSEFHCGSFILYKCVHSPRVFIVVDNDRITPNLNSL